MTAPKIRDVTLITFDQKGDFAAKHAAEDWCKAHGISVGANQRGAPRGLMLGDYLVAKWRNLDPVDRTALCGIMQGDMRNGPVEIRLKAAQRPAVAQPKGLRNDRQG